MLGVKCGIVGDLRKDGVGRRYMGERGGGITVNISHWRSPLCRSDK